MGFRVLSRLRFRSCFHATLSIRTCLSPKVYHLHAYSDYLWFSSAHIWDAKINLIQECGTTQLCVGQKMCVTIKNIHSNAIITVGNLLEIIATDQSNQHTYRDTWEMRSLLADCGTPCPHTPISTAFTYCAIIRNT